MIWTLAFWKAATERALSTLAQALLAVWFAGDNGVLDLFAIDWRGALSVGVSALVASYLKSLVASQIGNNGPSFVQAEELTGRHARR